MAMAADEHHDLAGLRRLMLETYEGEDPEEILPRSETESFECLPPEESHGTVGHQQVSHQATQPSHPPHLHHHHQQQQPPAQHVPQQCQSMPAGGNRSRSEGLLEVDHQQLFTQHPPKEHVQISTNNQQHPHAGFYSSGPSWGSLGGQFQNFDVCGADLSCHVHLPCEPPMASPGSSKATRLESEGSLYGIGGQGHQRKSDFMTGRPIYSSKICKLKLRVTCDSDDCRQLLEVEIPASSPEETIVVQCESCQNLITVDVRQSLQQPPQPFRQTEVAPEGKAAETENSRAPRGTKGSRGVGRPRRQTNVAALQKGSTPMPEAQVKGPRSKTARPAKLHALPSEQSSGPAAKKTGRPRSTSYMSQELPSFLQKETQQCKRAKKYTRGPSQYNLFIAEEIPRLKAIRPGMNHKDAFKLAARHWKSSPMNVKQGRSNEKEDELVSNVSQSPDYELQYLALPLGEPTEDDPMPSPVTEES